MGLFFLLDTEELQVPNLSGEKEIHQHSCAHFSAQFVLFFNPSRKVLIENMQPQTQNIARGTTDPGYRVYNLSYLSS